MVTEKWLVSRRVDLLFVCGGLPWILGGMFHLILDLGIRSWDFGLGEFGANNLAICWIVGSLLIGESHQFTSILRLAKFRIYTPRVKVLLAIILLCLVFLSFSFDFKDLPAFVSIPVSLAISAFPVILINHFCIQARSVGLLYCTKAGYILNSYQMRQLKLITWMLVAAGSFNVATPFLPEPLLTAYSQDLRFYIGILLMVALPCAMLLFVEDTYRRNKLSGERFPLGATLTWFNLALWILLPIKALHFVWIFVPVFYHASQHWILSWISSENNSQMKSSFWCYFMRIYYHAAPTLSVTLIVLFLPILFGTRGTLSAVWSMAVFYVHYLADGVVWKRQAAQPS